MYYLKSLRSLSDLFPRIIFTFLLLFTLGIDPCFAQTYYVDSSTGSDNNNGLTKETAFRTLSKVSISSFSAGDSILFKRGEEWNERLKFPSSGSDGNPITIGAYGSGNKPKFTFNRIATAWLREGEGVYSCTINAREGFFEDGKIIHYASSPYCSDGNWYYSLGRTYYKPTSGVPSDHSLKYSTSYYLINLDSKSYINIENIELTYAGGGIYVSEGSHINIRNCDLSHIYGWAIQFKNTDGHCSATGNIITNVIDAIYFVGNPGDNHLISNNTISHCNYAEYNGRDGHGIALQNANNNVIINNTISYCRMAPIAIWVASGKTGNNNVISYNRISDNKKVYSHSFYGTGIAITSDDGGTTSGNKVYYNIIENCNVGIKLSRANSPGNEVYNNVIYDCGQGLKLSVGADNNIFENNVICGTDTLHINSQHADIGDNNIFDNNCYFPDLVNGFKHKGGVLPNFAAWKAATGNDANSMDSDPLFVDTQLFGLSPESPCIDAGVDVGLAQDVHGKPVPQGDGVDIGPNEFSPLAPPKNVRLVQ